MVEIYLDTRSLAGSINMIGENGIAVSVEAGDEILANRSPREDLEVDEYLPDYIRQWALIQHLSGGPWGGCIEDYESLKLSLEGAGSPTRASNSVV